MDLGFLPPEPAIEQTRVRFEVPLSELEDNLWSSFHDWIE